MSDKPIKVLLIEDNPGDARIIKELLSEANMASFQVEVAKSLSDGIDALSARRFDVVLLDLSLPDSSGLETLVKVHTKAQKLAIIVLTGLSDEALAVEAVRKGAQDYLVKGQIDKNLLYRAILYAIERKQVEEEKKKLQAQLQQAQKMEAIGTLAGGIAHDFNNILSLVIGYTELALVDVPEESPVWDNINEACNAGKRARDLVRQILTFSRQSESERKPVKIHLIVTEALKLIRSSLPTTIEIRENITTTGMALVDPMQIEQVIMNLAANAYHAMRETGGLLEVSLHNVECGMRI